MKVTTKWARLGRHRGDGCARRGCGRATSSSSATKSEQHAPAAAATPDLAAALGTEKKADRHADRARPAQPRVRPGDLPRVPPGGRGRGQVHQRLQGRHRRASGRAGGVRDRRPAVDLSAAARARSSTRSRSRSSAAPTPAPRARSPSTSARTSPTSAASRSRRSRATRPTRSSSISISSATTPPPPPTRPRTSAPRRRRSSTPTTPRASSPASA